MGDIMPEELRSRPFRITAAATVALLFGALTVVSGGSVALFDGPARMAAGDYVPFVVWFNFLAGFAYVAAGLGLLFARAWAVKLSLAIVVATLLVATGLGLHVLLGGAYELRTAAALALRILVWTAIAGTAHSAWRTASWKA